MDLNIQPIPQWPIILAKVASSMAIILGMGTIMAWIFYFWIPVNYQLLLTPVTPNTAICFILSGISLWLQSEKNKKLSPLHYLALISSAGVFLLAFLSLFEYFFNINIGVDEGLFKEPLSHLRAISELPPGRISPFAATNFALIGFTLFFLDDKDVGYQIHQLFMTIVTLLSSLQLLLHLYRSSMVAMFGFAVAESHSAIFVLLVFFLLGLGILLARPEKGLTSILVSKNIGGSLARRLIPPATIIPIIVGYFGLVGKWTGYYEVELGIVFLVESTIICFVSLILIDAFLVNRVDIKRRQIEHALKLNEAQLQAILDHTSAMIYIHDLEGKYLLVNKQFEKSFYKKAEDIIGRRSHDIFSPMLADTFVENAFKVIQTRQPIAVEEIVLDQDGEHIYIANKFPLFDEHGTLYAIGTISTDITQIKHISNSLRENEERLNLALKSAEAGTWSWDILKDKFTWDDYTHHLFGLKPKTFPGYYEATLSLIHPDDRKQVANTVEQTLNEGTEFNSEFRIIRPNQAIRYLGLRGRVYRDDIDQPIRMTGVCWDITERKQADAALRRQKEIAEELAEQAKEASQAKSAFLAAMSHEIRTPLNGVISMTGLMADTILSTEQREYVETIRISGEALLSVINDILDFSKIESGRMELEKIDFDIYALVEDTIELVAAQIQSKGIAIGAFIESDVPPWLTGDSSRIRQVLNNLLSNAAKFTEQGEISVKVQLEKKIDKTVTILFQVSDTGIGISPEIRSQLFQPFSQGDSSTSRKYGGTGLGLAISKRLVEILGGTITLESSPGRGSTFSFSIPLLECKIPNAEEAAPIDLSEKCAGLRILCVDDNAINREVVKRQTESWKMRCDVAANAAEALSMLKKATNEKDPYVLALIDYIMPGMNGLELIQIIRQLKEFESIFIILLSSLGTTFSIEELKTLDIAMSLSKPVRQTKLCENIAAVLTIAHEKNGPLIPQKEIKPVIPQSSLKTRILLAEDNAINRQVALRILDKIGYRADIANNGIDVLQAIKKYPYDLILMDCQMPEMDGYTATEKIRELEKKQKGHIPIIAMTAHALKGDREKCLSAGMDDYIAKPIDIKMLAIILNRWTQKATIDQNKNKETPDISNLPSPSDKKRNLIDWGRLHDIFGEDSTIIKEFIKNFLSSNQVLIKELQSAIQKKQQQQTKELFHRLKGSAGNSGMASLYEACKHSEEKVLHSDWVTIKQIFQQVKKILKQLEQEIENKE